ncbi:uncharacterized protein KZ484_023202 [Pholidichthys leucotaenia]
MKISEEIWMLLLLVSQHASGVEVVEGEVKFVLLPCESPTFEMKNPSVEWSRSNLNPPTVHLLLQEGDDLQNQNQNYRGRTSMVRNALEEGDLTLNLTQPSVYDTGNYSCIIYSSENEVRQFKVQLQVHSSGVPIWARFMVVLVLLVLLGAIIGGLLYHFRLYFMRVPVVEVDSGATSARLPFITTDPLPKYGKVEWTDDNNRKVHVFQNGSVPHPEHDEKYRKRTKMKMKRLMHNNLSLTLMKPTEMDTQTYVCRVYDRDGCVLKEKEVMLKVRAPGISKLVIIAIDLGTAYSGYAYSSPAGGTIFDPHFRKWGNKLGLDSPKTPTCILFSEQGEFFKFGYEARTAYNNMRGSERKKHVYFENFKMDLWNKKLNTDVVIKDSNGKLMKALKVFSESLRFLKEDALKTITETLNREKFTASDCTWVLTVPAVWDPSAKKFMREAAVQAGIVTKETQDKQVIVLEPVAASVWCKNLPSHDFRDGEALDNQPGTQYIVVDCGGETIDIIVHEVLDGGRLKELYKTSRNDLGGETVDRKFKKFLREIFCDGVWQQYETSYPGEVQRMIYDFMYLKQVHDDVDLTCPYNLGMIAQNQKVIDKFFDAVVGASWNEGSIRISRDKLRSFFEDSLSGITELLQEILKKHPKIKCILLVGGYAESQVLRQHIKDQFGGKRCKVLCPFKPQQAILRGAVLFGSNPAVVASHKNKVHVISRQELDRPEVWFRFRSGSKESEAVVEDFPGEMKLPEEFWTLLLLLVSQLASGVEVKEGEEFVLLPCNVSISDHDNSSVEWSRSNLSPSMVHLRGPEGDDLQKQNQRYRGRTSMVRNAMETGDFSLNLTTPKVNDTGDYSCTVWRFGVKLHRSEVKLQVQSGGVPTWVIVLMVLLVVVGAVIWSVLSHFRHYCTKVFRVDVDSGVESVRLPFKISGCLPLDAKVKWTDNNRTVHVYQKHSDQLDKQCEAYKGRTEMNEELLKDGDLSLTLKYPSDRDNYTYTCKVYRQGKILTITKVKLNVRVPRVEVESGVESVLLPFKTTGDLPEDVKVEWTNWDNRKVHVFHCGSDFSKEPDHEYRNRTEMKEDMLKTGDLSLTMKYPRYEDAHTFTCTIYRDENILMKKQVKLEVKDCQLEVDEGVASVLLPFKVPPELTQKMEVKWIRVEPKLGITVHVSPDQKNQHQDQRYRGRTEMKEDLLKTGDLGLILKQPTVMDSGVYRCFLRRLDRKRFVCRHTTVLLRVRGTVQVQDPEEQAGNRILSVEMSPLLASPS